MDWARDSLAGLCSAAAGKDPGFTPLSLLELLKRRGRHREEEIRRLNLAESFDRKTAKGEWMKALDDPRFYDGSADSAREAGRLNREIRKTQGALDRAMARWAEAVETLEGLEGS